MPDSTVNTKIKSLIEKGKLTQKIVVFGASTLGRETAEFLCEQHIDFHFFCDNDKKKTGTAFCGKTTLSPNRLLEAKDDIYLIIIASSYYKEIYRQLKDMGLDTISVSYSYFKLRYLSFITRQKHQKEGVNYTQTQLALNWLNEYTLATGGICVGSVLKIPYPEVTGYMIPSLLEYGMKDFAISQARWLCSIQKNNGGFAEPHSDAIFLFDTGQALRGLMAAAPFDETVKEAAKKTAEFLYNSMLNEGREGFPNQYAMYSALIPEEIMLYALPPLIDAGKLFHEDKYERAVKNCVDYYIKQERFLSLKTLTHFLAYQIEALIDIGHKDKVMDLLEELRRRQSPNGAVAAFDGVAWVCIPGLAQIAICWYKTGFCQWQTENVFLWQLKNVC